MWGSLISFFSFAEPNTKFVVLGAIIVTSSAAIVGTFTFLHKKSLVGDAIAHSVLPGVCIAFLIVGHKDPLALIIGAFVSGWLSLMTINYITAHSRIKEDTAIGLTLSVFFSIGMLLLTSIQHSGNAEQSGLASFIFGKTAALVAEDLVIFSIIGLMLIAAVLFFYKEFKLITFDCNYAQAIGLPVKKLDFLLTTLTVLAVVVGIQAVGLVLIAAMLITPVAAARFWTNKLSFLLIISTMIGVVSGIFGSFISYVAPSMPTGPWIVLVASIIAITSFFIAPRKGLIARFYQQRKNRKRILEENILKALYHIVEEKGGVITNSSVQEIICQRFFKEKELLQALLKLKKSGYVLRSKQNTWQVTTEGKEKGQRIVKLHRLWEVYLAEHLYLAPDHVHEEAETMEHIITPEIEKELEEKLSYPRRDPHHTIIPYQ